MINTLLTLLITVFIASADVDMRCVHPELVVRSAQVLVELEAKGWQPKIHGACRTIEEQREKVRKGYSQTMNSKHLIGRAVDIIDKRWGWSGPTQDQKHQFWKDLGQACEKNGLFWGGRWKNFVDVAHCEYRGK